MENNIVTPL